MNVNSRFIVGNGFEFISSFLDGKIFCQTLEYNNEMNSFSVTFPGTLTPEKLREMADFLEKTLKMHKESL